MAEKNHPPPLTPILQERVSAELYELNKKLQKQLRQDINRIFSESLFSDLDLSVKEIRIKAHRAVLSARVPRFYSEISEASQQTFDKLNPHLIESFVRQVYNQNVIKHKEDAVLEQLRKLKRRKRGGVQGTPDSDVFLTPKDSPGEAPDTYRGGTCQFPKADPPTVDRRKSSLYYNLVHLEEDFNSPSSSVSTNNLLEKELAEQDQLFQSFHSIIIKEGQDDKKKAGLSEQPQTQSQPKKKKVAIVKPVKKIVKPKIFTKPIKNEYIDCGFDSEYLALEGNYKSKGMNYGGKGEEGMSRHQESRDSPIGPSSGASSPSVTWDSVMQDPPVSHHCVLSPGDSPSASHPTTYYSSPEPQSKPLTSPSPPKSPLNPLSDKPGSPRDKEKIVTHDRAVSPVNFLEKISPAEDVLPREDINHSSVVADSFSSGGPLPMPTDPIIMCAEVPPLQIKTVPCPTNLNSQPDSQILNQDLKTDTLCTVKTNYFIDASNLTDEAEGDLINNLSVAYITRSAIDFVEPKLVTKEIDDPTYSKELDNLSLCNTVTNSHEIINKDCQNNISISSDQIFDTPLKSLARHNTFDADSKTMINTRVILNNVNDLNAGSNFNTDLYPKTELIKCMNINTFQTCDVGVQNNESLFVPLSESKHAQTDDDGHSPDSLTNDCVRNDYSPSMPVQGDSDKCILQDIIQSELMPSTGAVKAVNNSKSDPVNTQLGIVNITSKCEPTVEASKLLETVSIANDVQDPLNLSEILPDDIAAFNSDEGRSLIDRAVESPRIRRKTEEAPILSGAAIITPEVEEKPLKPKVSNSLTTSWTIDMSDSVTPCSVNERKKGERVKSVKSSFGFFVPLNNDPPQAGEIEPIQKKTRETRKSVNEDDTANSSQGSSCGFYVDLRNDFESLDSQISLQSGDTDNFKPEKKLFSMFIDISDSCSKSSDSASPKSKISSPFLPPRKPRVKNQSVSRCEDPPTSLSSDSGLDMGVGEHPEVVRGKTLFGSGTAANTSTSSSSETSKKQSFYMFIGANESKPSNKRKNMPLGLSQSSSRLSWTSENGQTLLDPCHNTKNEHVYKRAHSLNDKPNSTVVEDTQLSGPASIDTASVQKTVINGSSNRMMSSWHGVVKPSSELSKIIKNSKSKDNSQKDNLSNSISEKFDKDDISSSVKSDDVFDSNASVSSKDENRTFVLDDVSKIAQANTSELEASTTSSHDIISDLSKDDSETDKIQEASVCSNKTKKSEKFNLETDSSSHIPAVEETFDRRHKIADDDGYVKLSDMDRIMPNYSRDNRKNSRMTRSIPEGSTVFENKILTKSSTSRSLSRLFPHLSSQFQVEPDEPPSNTSMQSSFNPSLEASAEGFVGECSRLGEDLLRMFLEEISPDVVVEVGGRRIKAHKCILSSRCQYFAAMLSGGWVESAGNVISLPGFSYNTVHFALCHIYSGASIVPESINIVELATLADMLCLEGLKEVITYTLKVKYCHFFHKPCSECIVGCVECLPVAAAYGLDEIYRKSLRWISKHFTRVWPTKSFASLPKELHDKCYKQHIVHMNAENILETIMGCEKLEATIPNVRWAQTIFSLNSKLQDTSHKYLTNHFKEVLSSNAFLSLSREDSWTIGRLEDVLLTLAELLQPDQAVHSYGKLNAMVAAITPQTEFKMEFLNLLKKLERRVEEALIKQAGRAIRTPAWIKLDPSLRKKIQEAACLVFTPGDSKRNTVMNLQQRSLSKTELAGVANSLERKRSLLSKSRPTSSKSVPPPNKNKPVATQSKPASMPPPKSSSVVGSRLANSKIPSSANVSKPALRSSLPCQPPALRQAKSQTTTSSSATPSPLLKSRNSRFAQVKSRYLDPKPERKTPNESLGRESRSSARCTTASRSSRNVGSSSDSSRTASPACMRHPHAMSTDSLEAATQPAPSRVSSAPPPRLNKNSLTQARPRTKPTVGPRSSNTMKSSK